MAEKKILIVDDESTHLEIIVDVLEEEGSVHRILQAFNGEVAFTIAEKEVPDLIITDWDMPQMDGIQLLYHLKSSEKTKDIPVIMCTGVMTSSENLETALNAGAVDYIRKPVDRIELVARTRANLRLSENYKKIKRMNQTKNKFFSIISHDVKSPLNSLLSFTQLISNHVNHLSREEIRKMACDLGESVKNVNALLENLLEWSNTQSDVLDFTPESINLTTILETNKELLEDQARKKHITIENKVIEDLMIKAHYHSLCAVVRNLISNAIKFTYEHGKITLDAIKEKDAIVVSVADTGVGISQEVLENIFQLKVQHITEGTANEKGTGLGLKLCQELIEKMKGQIWVESEIGKGSIFRFSIPVSSRSAV